MKEALSAAGIPLGDGGSARPSISGSGSSGVAATGKQPAKAIAKKGLLMPPQLSGRRNVTTEELSNMRTAKRNKPPPPL